MKRVLFTVSMICIMIMLSNSVQSQLLPTNLQVTVLDDLGNVVEGATVIIFENEEDYRFENNPAFGPELTDKKGRVTFKKIPAKSYYVFVSKGDKNNDGKGVKTSRLEPGKKNQINVVIL
ncbi:MAG: carboxypeptidase-like regulatory domain-containing protein [Cyclobacteriaceae bacterium]